MSAEATNPGAHSRRRGRPRIDLRRLGRAALLGPVSRDRLPDAIGHVADAHRAHHPDADLAVLHRAYVLAETSHRGQFRKSGEPYITHPLAVTLILAELGAETTTLTASLLHDTVEDTEVTLDQVRAEFGEEVTLSGRRRHQAGEGRLRRGGRARDLPQDARRHRQRRPRDVDQTRRPAAQHAHPRRDAPRETGPDRQGHQGRADPARRTPRRAGPQVRTGGPGLRDPAPRGVRAHPRPDRGRLRRRRPARRDRRRACARVLREAGIHAEVLIRPRHFVSVHRVQLKRGELRGSRLRPAARPGRRGRRLLRGPRRTAHLLHAGRSPSSRTSSPRPSSTCTSRCTRRSSARTARSPKSSSAPTRCTRSPRPASSRSATPTRRGPPARRAAAGRATSARTRPGPAGSPASSTGSRTPPTPTRSGPPCARNWRGDREITVFRADGRTLGPAGRRELRGRRVRAVRRGRPQLHRRPRQRPPGDAQYGAAATATPCSCCSPRTPPPGPRPTGSTTPGPRPRGSRSAAGSRPTRRAPRCRPPRPGRQVNVPADRRDGRQRGDRPAGRDGTARGLLHARAARRGHRILGARRRR